MTNETLPVVVGWTGASGLFYGVRLVEVLLRTGREVHLLTSAAVEQTAPVELGRPVEDVIAELEPLGRLRRFGLHEFDAPAASGSARLAGMAICPCSTGTLGRIAAGTSETLLLRAADVCLKERRRLVLVPRETPLSTVHLRNMATLSGDGAVILPAAPGFYNRPASIEDLIDFIVQRVCDHLDVVVDLARRWGSDA